MRLPWSLAMISTRPFLYTPTHESAAPQETTLSCRETTLDKENGFSHRSLEGLNISKLMDNSRQAQPDQWELLHDCSTSGIVGPYIQ